MRLRRPIAVCAIAFVGGGGSWLAYTLMQREHLRVATAEAARLCTHFAKNASCPRVVSRHRTDQAQLDPWDRPYGCRPTKDGGVAIFSLGADGIASGEEQNADVLCIPFASTPPTGGSNACFCRVGGDAAAFDN